MPVNHIQSSSSRRLRLAFAAATTLACLAFAPSVLAASINPVAGSPFGTGGDGPTAVAFSPGGGLLATSNNAESSITDNGWASDLSVFSVSATGALSPVTGSPFASGTDPLGGGNEPLAITFSPNGQLLATAEGDDPTPPGSVNVNSSGVSVYAVGAGGALSAVTGSPFLLPSVPPRSLAFSPNGGLLAVNGGGGITVFAVGAGGTLTQVPGSPYLYGLVNVASVAFSPNGQFLAAGIQGAGVDIFSVGSNGALTLVPGSPFGVPTGIYVPPSNSVVFSPSGGLLAVTGPQGVFTFSVAANGTLTQTPGSPYTSANFGKLAFSPNGGLLALTTLGANTVQLFSVAASGALTPLSDSPYATGNFPLGVAFSPNGGVLAVNNEDDDTVSVFSVGAAPSVAAPTVTGTLGSNGWYTSNVTLGWSISDPLAPLSFTTSGCVNQTITADEPATVYSCSASNAAGTGGPVSVTIQRDATPPAISFTGNTGAYTVNQTVTISCAASALSGIASSSCPGVAGVPAYTLAAGSHTLSASATDHAGLTSTASTSFTVSVTPASLCTLTTQFVEGSANYQKLSAKQQATINALATAACTTLNTITTKLPAAAQAVLIGLYKLAINALVAPGWLTNTQATTLTTLATTL